MIYIYINIYIISFTIKIWGLRLELAYQKCINFISLLKVSFNLIDT